MQSGTIFLSLFRIRRGIASALNKVCDEKRLHGSYHHSLRLRYAARPHVRDKDAWQQTAGDACKYAHVRTRVCRSIINIIAVARDEEALAVSLRSCPARPPLPSPYKEKIPRRGNQRFYT